MNPAAAATPPAMFALVSRSCISRFAPRLLGPALLAFTLLLATLPATLPAPGRAAEPSAIPAFAQAVAEAAAQDEEIAAFYRDNGYRPVWTDTGELARERREALFNALARAGDHGLPVASYGLEALEAQLRDISSPRQQGRVEVELSRLFLLYARQLTSGVLVPREVVPDIVREVPLRDRRALLDEFLAADPARYLRSLAPEAPEYARLMGEKLRLERLRARGGWGAKVPADSLRPGQSGQAVVALRNRLIAMGYMERSATRTYDAALQRAVQAFQADHGLEPDGVAGKSTIRAINVGIDKRLASIIVALERERWMNIERGKRHIWVNLTDFTAKIVDDGKVTFETRSVIGMNASDRRSPEFSDMMEYMEVNPYWNVPRSIATKEYLPRMLENPAAAGHLQLVDGAGRVVPRSAVDFSQYTPANFPFDLRQAPSRSNALGLVKFMFPNPYNIYLHDTPSKSLFQREVRAFSHGCIRLQRPFDFAYALLAPQSDDPEGEFQRVLRSGKNTRIDIVPNVPVHLVYRTAIMPATGRAQYRNDIYGRDARIFAALQAAGVEVGGLEG